MSTVEAAFDHTPIRPVRSDVIGEQVFVEAWQALMSKEPPSIWDTESPNAQLYAVLSRVSGRLTQRHASVSASVIRWLGTNNGRAFLAQAEGLAERLAGSLFCRTSAFVMAWGNENQRLNFRDFGLRTIEMVLAPAHEITENGRDTKRTPLSASDYETVESVVAWLAEGAGHTFLKGCQAEIDRRLKEERAARREADIQRIQQRTVAASN